MSPHSPTVNQRESTWTRQRLAASHCKLVAARQLLYHAAWLDSVGKDSVTEVSMVKAHCAEVAQEVMYVCQQFHGDPQTCREGIEYPAVVRAQDELIVRHPEQHAVRQPVGEVIRGQGVAALVGRATTTGNQSTQLGIAAVIPRQRDEFQAGIETELGTDDQLREIDLACRHVRTDDAGYGTLIGQRQRTIAERSGPFDQFLGMRGAAEEGEVAERMQLGIRRRHRC